MTAIWAEDLDRVKDVHSINLHLGDEPDKEVKLSWKMKFQRWGVFRERDFY